MKINKKTKARIFYVFVLITFVVSGLFIYFDRDSLASNVLSFTDEFNDTSNIDWDLSWVKWNGGDFKLQLDTYNTYTSSDQSNYLTTNLIERMSFIDANNGFAVTKGYWYDSQGTLLKTTDGGANWTRLNTFSGNGEDVQFFNALDGYVSNNNLLKTTDGGATFTDVSSHGSLPGGALGLYFLDFNHGWLVGIDRMIAYTADGGANWTVQHSEPVTSHFNDVFAIDANNAWAVGGDGHIWKFDGINWTQQVSGTLAGLSGVHFLDALTGWAVGSGVALYTTDGGTTWNTSASFVSGTDVRFVDALNGWASGGNGNVYYSIDGGVTWTSSAINQAQPTYSIYPIDAANVFVGGSFGIIEKTTDGGTSWTTQNSAATYQGTITATEMRSNTLGYAVTTDGDVLKTTDGTTWGEVGWVPCGYLCRDMDFYSDTDGVIVA